MRRRRMYTVGERMVKVCKASGGAVIMEYTGDTSEDGSVNGHRGWLCLHNEDSFLDAVEADAFNAGLGRKRTMKGR